MIEYKPINKKKATREKWEQKEGPQSSALSHLGAQPRQMSWVHCQAGEKRASWEKQILAELEKWTCVHLDLCHRKELAKKRLMP